jgi:hypothetical protein
MDTLQGILEGETASFIRPADQIMVGLLAVVLRRIKQCEQYLDKTGSLTNKKGELRPVAELMVKLLKEARGYCETLGLTPASRAKLGVDVARTFDLAAAFAEGEVKQNTTKDSAMEE